MPNGGDRNWIRATLAMEGFRLKYGHWPSQLLVSRAMRADIEGLFEADDFEAVCEKIAFVDSDVEFVVRDAAGNTYRYGETDFPSEMLDVTATEWLKVWPTRHED